MRPNAEHEQTAASVNDRNPDRDSTGGQRGCFLLLAATGCPTLHIPVDSADIASAMLAAYRERYGVGASDMKEGCGDIRAEDGTLVARVSYNGRVWTPDGILLQEPGME